MKTNFEKWRDSLTPEGARIIVGCDFCPNRKCPFKDDYSGDDKCSSSYLAWANAPAKEEELAYLTFCEDKIAKWLKMEATK